jgi:AcrR family transcriptional regulator
VAGPDPALSALGEQVAKGSVAGRRDRYEAEVIALVRAVHRLTRHRTYGDTTVSEILDEAGLSTRAFYRHFASKDELLVTVFDYETALVTDQLLAAVEDGTDAAARFERWLEWYLLLFADARRLSRFVTLQQEHDRLARDHRERMAALDARRDAVLVAILALGVADGSFPTAEPEADAPVIQSLVVGFLRRAATGESVELTEVQRQLRRFCAPVLGAR